MKLLQIGPYPPPLGGWSYHIKVFKEYLDKNDIENCVLNTGPNRKIKSEAYFDVQNSLDYCLKVFKQRREGYFIYIHLNGDSNKGFALTLLAQLISFLFLEKTALSFHAGVVQECFAKRISLQKIFASMVFFLAGGIMCNSEEVKEKIVALGQDRNKIHAIPCFSMQYLEHESVMTDEEEAFISKRDPIISSYLFFREEYEPDTIISALKIVSRQYPNFGCFFIGSKEGAETYQDEIERAGLSRNFFFAGEKSHDNFMTLLEKSDINLRAHIRDGVCSSVMEALALGTPVIACDNGTRPPEVILFKSKDSRDLAEKVIATLENLSTYRGRLASIVRRDAIKEELEFLVTTAGKA